MDAHGVVRRTYSLATCDLSRVEVMAPQMGLVWLSKCLVLLVHAGYYVCILPCLLISFRNRCILSAYTINATCHVMSSGGLRTIPRVPPPPAEAKDGMAPVFLGLSGGILRMVLRPQHWVR